MIDDLHLDPLRRADHHAVDLHHRQRKRIDWSRVHLAADRRKPFAPQHRPTKLDYAEAGR